MKNIHSTTFYSMTLLDLFVSICSSLWSSWPDFSLFFFFYFLSKLIFSNCFHYIITCFPFWKMKQDILTRIPWKTIYLFVRALPACGRSAGAIRQVSAVESIGIAGMSVTGHCGGIWLFWLKPQSFFWQEKEPARLLFTLPHNQVS